MSEHIYNYRDPNSSLYQVNSNYALLLQIYPASFSYAVVYQNRLIAWCEDCDLHLLDEPGEAHEFLNFEYKNVVTALPATGFTLMPNALFNADKVADLARFLDVKPSEKVLAQPLDDDNHIIYKVDDAIVKTAKMFGLQKTVYMAKGWINAVEGSNPPADNLYLNIDKQQVEILYFAAGNLRFYNTFTFNNPDELVYYTGFVAKELELQPHRLNLVLSGDINRDDKNASRLAEFFNGVEESSLKVLDLPDEIFPHQILALSALSLCVSSEVF